MRRDRLRSLLESVADGSVAVDAALNSLALDPVESLGFATIDHHRALRQGFPEVVYGAGKTVDQVIAIARRIAERGDGVLITRVEPDAVLPLSDAFAEMEYNPIGRTALLRANTPAEKSKDAVL